MSNVEHLLAMHTTHGVGPAGRTCGECTHCVVIRLPHVARANGVTFTYCRQAPFRVNQHGKAMRRPWLKRWAACGKFSASESLEQE